MTNILRVRCIWSGFPGGPGVSTHYLGVGYPAGSIAAIRTFYNALAGLLPNTLNIQVPGSGDLIDDASGSIVGTWSDTTPAVVAGSSASGYAAPVGALVRWNTGGIVAGRRVRGKTFIVPGVNMFEPGGTPIASAITTMTTAATALVTATTPALLVWARPFDPVPPDTRPHRDGTSHAVTSAFVPDKSMVLLSRRD
jgi:hypothetical protein